MNNVLAALFAQSTKVPTTAPPALKVPLATSVVTLKAADSTATFAPKAVVAILTKVQPPSANRPVVNKVSVLNLD
ncbi:MAG: hypothetical protein H7240_00505 [Glaciimonas sp.]|nr:hypothetical protein [Glaciimonas sp.]